MIGRILKSPRAAMVLLLPLGSLLPLASLGQVLDLPGRATNALPGTEFCRSIASLSLAEREAKILSEVLAGNVPPFLRKLSPVRITNVEESTTNIATFYVTPDYIAIGSDDDYFLAPISPATAQRLADALHCTLPTRKMVDAIYHAAAVKLSPQPIPPSPAMTSVAVFSNHNALVREQRNRTLAQQPLGALVAGHQKDLVISAKLAGARGKVAIYGWHQPNGIAIQPLYLGHSASWVDYSQCTRLVQQKMTVNGMTKSVSDVLADPGTAALLSDEGVILNPRYSTNLMSEGVPAGAGALDPTRAHQLHETNVLGEHITVLELEPDVKVTVNSPGPDCFVSGRKLMLVYYALPNGNTTEQTVGKNPQPGDDWRYDIQHIGAQTRFLREMLTNRVVIVAYLENALLSWPAWRKMHGDQSIPGLLAAVRNLFPGRQAETVLTGHSGGGSLIFGYLNTVDRIPDDVARIAFLDSNYAYDKSQGHTAKLINWLRSPPPHYLCVLAYNDAIALLNGKAFVSEAGGTWGRSHAMERDLEGSFQFERRTDAEFERFLALGGRVQFLLKENPERKILHTVQIERNGFIHAMVSGTSDETKGYRYWGPRAYSRFIQ